MTINRKLYPPKWREVMRKEALERAGYCCEDCGLPDGTMRINREVEHPFFPEGKPSHIWLQLSHKREYVTWDREAETAVLCPSCHGKFDKTHRRRHLSGYVPVGQVIVWVHYKGQRCLAAEAKAFDDLFGTIAAFSEGMQFELEAEVLRQVAGVGHYRKELGGVTVLHEEGACITFGMFLDQVFFQSPTGKAKRTDFLPLL